MAENEQRIQKMGAHNEEGLFLLLIFFKDVYRIQYLRAYKYQIHEKIFYN